MTGKGNAELTRIHILQAAADIIAESGLAALTAGSLISRAGISKGGLYHHFRQMDDVILAVLDLLVDQYLAELGTARCSSAQEFFAQVERDLFGYYLSRSRTVRAIHGYLSATMYDKSYRTAMQRLLVGLSALRKRQLCCAFPHAQESALSGAAELLETFMLGLVLRNYLAQDEQVVRQHWEGFRSLLQAALLPSERHSVAALAS